MAINFPDSPTNGQQYTVGGITFVYDSTANRWDSNGESSTTTISDNAPSNPTTGDMWFDSSNAVLYIYYDDGDTSQWIGVSQLGGGTLVADSAVTTYATLVARDAATPTTGDLAFVTANKSLYLYDGTEWDRISAGVDESPVILTEPPTTSNLNQDGSTSTVTMVAQDPEGFDIEYGIAYKTTGNALPSQLASATTVNANGEFTFTPSSNTSNAGSFRARLSASDGARTTTRFVDFSLAFAATVDYLVVAGGGAGGGTTNGAGEGGGGAGGLIYTTGASFDNGKTFNITVGDGGVGSTGTGASGANSVISATGFTTVTAIGGGGGGSSTSASNGQPGGSGGGQSYGSPSATGGAGTAGQGNKGGDKAVSPSNYPGGGGGGAGAEGGQAVGSTAGSGGDGLEISITGTPTYYAGGGGAASRGTNGTGGLGGGGNAQQSGTPNTGGGGGGALNSGSGGSGGSGIVIIRTTSTAASTTGSPTVTTDGSYNIYSFTADGSITF